MSVGLTDAPVLRKNKTEACNDTSRLCRGNARHRRSFALFETGRNAGSFIVGRAMMIPASTA